MSTRLAPLALLLAACATSPMPPAAGPAPPVLAPEGFRLVAQGSFLRNPADPRDWNAAPTAANNAGKRGTSDRFALAFERP